MNIETCKTCIFCEEIELAKGHGMPSCRANPPTPIPIPSVNAHTQQMEIRVQSVYPAVNPERDWCGMYDPMGEVQEELELRENKNETQEEGENGTTK